MNAYRPLEAILFDMDGTLLDSSAAVHRAWSAWAVRNRLNPADVLRICQGRRAIDTIAELVPHLDIQAEADWMLNAELNDTHGIVQIPGSGALVQTLAAHQWAVVTSASRSLAQARLRAAGLPMPEVLITAELVRAGKPDPEGFLLGAKHLGVAPQACLVVEDTPAGLTAGRRAGMQLLGISTTYPAADLPCEQVIADYAGVQISAAATLHIAIS